jgi:hypothetical protein
MEREGGKARGREGRGRNRKIVSDSVSNSNSTFKVITDPHPDP